MDRLVYKHAMAKIAEYYSESFSSSKSSVNGKEDSKAAYTKQRNEKKVKVRATKLHGLPTIVEVEKNA